MRRWLVALALVVLAPGLVGIMLPRRRTAVAAAGGLISQFWASPTGELADPDNSESFYAWPFGMPIGHTNPEGGAGTPNAEGDYFGVLSTAGTLSEFSVTNPYGGLESGDSFTVTLRRCAGGTIPSCSWADTNFSVTATGAGTTFWEETGGTTVSVSAGDGFARRTFVDNADASLGPTDALGTVMIFTPSTPGYSVLTSGVDLEGVSAEHFSLAGANSGLQADSNIDRVLFPVPGSFTIVNMYAAVDVLPGSSIIISICKYDGTSDDANCGGTNIGNEIFNCTITNSGNANCNDVCATHGSSGGGTECSLSAGDLIYGRSSLQVNDTWLAVSLTLDSGAGDEWVSGTNGLTRNTEANAYASSGMSGYMTSICHSGLGNEQQCRARLSFAAQATHQRCRAAAALAAGAWTSDLRESTNSSGADSVDDVGCAMADGAESSSATANASIDDGDWFNYHSVETTESVTANVAYAIGTLWDDLTAGD